jgi:hypothetical protein
LNQGSKENKEGAGEGETDDAPKKESIKKSGHEDTGGGGLFGCCGPRTKAD